MPPQKRSKKAAAKRFRSSADGKFVTMNFSNAIQQRNTTVVAEVEDPTVVADIENHIAVSVQEEDDINEWVDLDDDLSEWMLSFNTEDGADEVIDEYLHENTFIDLENYAEEENRHQIEEWKKIMS